jgi:hypothetical protein
MTQQQMSTENFVKHILVFVLGVLALVLANSVVSATHVKSASAPAAYTPVSSSFDTQLNAAKKSIQQYADDQVWLYTPTKQEGSFDTQLSQALNQIRKN